jgi:PAS domain-containing protein
MNALSAILEKNEDWLMERVLDYAKQHGYTKYTSTLKEAWRLSISGLTDSIVNAIQSSDHQGIPELNSEEDLTVDPIARFGITEARRHRKRGVSLGMFSGLMKYYRQAYVDLIRQEAPTAEKRNEYELFINRVFDRIEIGFNVEWSGSDINTSLHELQMKNRLMTNEKNKFLTIFESIPNPIIILNQKNEIDTMNLAAVNLFKKDAVAGSQHYRIPGNRSVKLQPRFQEDEKDFDPGFLSGCSVAELFPWLEDELMAFKQNQAASNDFEKSIGAEANRIVYRVKFSKNLDVSGKFEGIIIILEDISSLKQALEEVKTLRGFLPICSYCKNIRDDKGFWQKVENYIRDRSEAEFSHSICPDCAKRHYPDYPINGE